MPRFLITITTAWCGMDQTYAAIANTEDELKYVAENAAYDNFVEFDCLAQIMEDEDIDEDAAIEIESEYYGYFIEEWDETSPEEEWDWYELIYTSGNATV